MRISIQRFFLFTIGLLFCVIGCTRDRGHMLMPDHISQPTEVMEATDIEASFEQDILPILTARCALAGCHVADGPHGLDFRTYESFTAGGEHGPAFIPGNAQESALVEQIVSGRMPPGGPPLTETEIQLFVNWINQQETQDGVIQQEHGDEHDDAHEEMDVEREDEEEHDGMDVEHDGEDGHEDEDEHDDDNGDGHADDDDNEHGDDQHDDNDDDN